MAYNTELAERIRELLAGKTGLTEWKRLLILLPHHLASGLDAEGSQQSYDQRRNK